MWRLIILAVAGSLIYGLPYFRTYYYDAYLQAYNLTNTQMGTLGSMFGVFGMISYLFGGVVADFISPKKLISISLVLTGVAGFCHLFATNYSMLLVIYLVWGFTALFAFWPALVKGIRSLASSEEQGKAFGFMEAGRGVTNAAHLAVALAIITFVSKSTGSSDMNATGLKPALSSTPSWSSCWASWCSCSSRIPRPTTSPSDSTSSRCSPSCACPRCGFSA